MCAQFGQRRVGLPGDQRLQALPSACRQQRLAATPVSLWFQRSAGFEVLTHPPHRRITIAEAIGNVAGAFTLAVKMKYPLTQWNRYVQFAGERSRMMTAVMARIALAIVWLVCACQGCPQKNKALRAGLFVCGSTVTVLAEPGSLPLGFRAGTCGQIRTHQENLT